jgi:carboxyl-terminal processing protease
MKKILSVFILLTIFFSFWIYQTNAIKIVSKETFELQQKPVTIEEAFKFYADFFEWKIPSSYKYIQLNIRWVAKDTPFYDTLQKFVYLDIIKNKDIFLKKDKTINKYYFYKIWEKVFNTKLIEKNQIKDLKNQKLKKIDLENFQYKLQNSKVDFDLADSDQKIAEKKEIFLDVYSTLKNRHYNKDNLDEIKMLNNAIEWLAKWTDDKFTTYFPPVANKNFNETLKGEYEWIWAYVDMEKPWVLKIISPISDSPAEKAWLRWWDIILKVDWREITKENWLREVVSWIKWPSWTSVKLTVKRWTRVFDLEVTRWKIIIKDVEYKLLNRNTYYIKLKFFWPTIASDFKIALKDLAKHRNVNKVIIDLRNNPGGYLSQVTDMLSNFVKKWEPVAVVKYYNSQRTYSSKWYDIVDFSKYKIVILQNSWSASASEIMIWWIKDYYPDTVLIWEKTYWKWSVQTIKDYSDGSSLKYTIAKWYTWKTETWIDWKWIEADIIMEDKYKKWDLDPLIQKALRLR